MCCLVEELQKMKTLIRKRRLFGTTRVRVRAKFRGRFRCQQIIDSWQSVRDPWESGAGGRYRIHDLKYGLYSIIMSFMISHICGMGHVAWIKLFWYDL